MLAEPGNHIERRDFIKALAGTLVSTAIPLSGSAAVYDIPLGVYTSYDQASYMKALGFSYIEEAVGRFLVPKEDQPSFRQNLEALNKNQFPIRSYVILLPPELKTLGPDANHEAILQRTELAIQRAKACNSGVIVFGSGASRIIPEGFDREKAKQQHIAVTRKMAPIAEKYGVTIAVEPLNRSETNFINSLAEGVEIIDAVKSPRVRLLCDIYHMLKEDEPANEIVRFGKHIVHCHIAEKEKRTPPGVKGDDFRPYLRALKTIRYKGALSIECLEYTDFEREIKTAFRVLSDQLRDV